MKKDICNSIIAVHILQIIKALDGKQITHKDNLKFKYHNFGRKL